MIDKQSVLDALRAKMEGDLTRLTASQNAAQEGAVHEETRQEDPKDTRAIEAQYLARGLAERVERLRDELALISGLAARAAGPEDEIGMAALVGVEADNAAEAIYLLVPCAGGEILMVDGQTIRTLTPGSPIGKALLGHRVDDELTLELPGRQVTASVCWIR